MKENVQLNNWNEQDGKVDTENGFVYSADADAVGGRGLCVFGGLCRRVTIGIPMVIFAVLTVFWLFWLFLTIGTLLVQS